MSKQGNEDGEIMTKKEEEDLVKILGDDLTGDIDNVYNQLTAKVEELETVNLIIIIKILKYNNNKYNK